MDNINLIENIEDTIKDISDDEDNIFDKNYNSDSYKRYLQLLKKYCMESKKPKFVSKFDYYVDDNGNLVKEARDPSNNMDNMVIIKPKYLNIEDKLENLTDLIQSSKVGLRQIRKHMIRDDSAIFKEDFDKLKAEYDKYILDKNMIMSEYNKQYTKNREELLDIKKQNIKFNLSQIDLKKQIASNTESSNFAERDKNIKEYLQNNQIINDNLHSIFKIKNSDTNDFLVLNVVENKKPKSQKPKKPKYKLQKKKEDLTSIPVPIPEESNEFEFNIDDEPEEEVEAKEAKAKEAEEEKEAKAKEAKAKEAKAKEAKAKEAKAEEEKEAKENNITQLNEKDNEIGAEELNILDDIESLEPTYEDLDEAEDEDEDTVFKNDSIQNPEEDKSIPPFLDSASEGEGEAEDEINLTELVAKAAGDDEPKKAKKPKLRIIPKKSKEVDLEQIEEVVNKKADPNIKVIKIDPDLKLSDSK